MAHEYKPGRLFVKETVCVLMLTSLLVGPIGCSKADPWRAPGLTAPGAVTDRSYFAITLRGRQLGVEERLVGSGELLRRRHYRFLVRGEVVDLWAGTREPAGSVVSDRDGPLVFEPLEGPTHGPPVDLAALLRVPHVAVPRARQSHFAELKTQGDVPGAVDGRLSIDHPIAAELLERDAIRAVLRETRASLTVHPTPGAPDALLALQSGKGDCNEHAVVFAKLASDAGLQARTAAGVVYDDSAFGPGFYPHAWAEVRTRDHGWVPVDPILGQVVADATHIPLGEGVFDARILSRLEHVRLEIVVIR